MTYLEKLKKINSRRTESANAERICSELCYLDGLSDLRGGKFDSRIEEAADALLSFIEKDGVITAAAVEKIEEMLSDLSPEAKSLKEIFVAHAHIDMNWMWGYNETAVITIETFRTMLKLMEEYPEFTFSQSQASTYEIVEKYCPRMLDEIRQRVAEGRWEVAAAEWVETDKNMPSGESLTRQILEAKKYLSGLLNIPQEKLNLDFLPDTFGHAVTVPEILCNAGIKYMYHCRGGKGPSLYYYQAPSGKKVLAYKDYKWYNGEVTPQYFEIVPNFCKQEGLDTFMCIYGVGDHGGGPSRRDIERILKYRSWPLTPDIRFGTYGEFFEIAENSGIDFPVVDTERNFVFAGCYTTQSRIKMANRISEARAYEAEVLSSTASVMSGAPYNPKSFESPWRNIVFNQFHDIIPGSGTIETREHALGKFQDTMATLQTSSASSMRSIADAIDTSFIAFDDETDAKSEGGGVGFATDASKDFNMPSTERGRGSTRVFHIFNPSYYDRDEVTEITVWDYNFDKAQVMFTDSEGETLEFCHLESGNGYWSHSFTKYAVKVKIPAFGYTTVILKQKPYEGRMNITPTVCEQVDHDIINDQPIILENDKIYAVFDRETACLIKLTDKQTGEALIDKPSCFFRYIEEKPESWLVAWRIGQYMKTVNINEESAVRIGEIRKTPLFSRISYSVEYNSSVINVVITLNKGSSKLDFDLNIDWKAESVKGKILPQLAFCVPVSYKTNGKSISQIPHGTIIRDSAAYDVPSHGSIGVCGESEHIIALLADTKYGFRCYEDTAQVALIRSSYFPDAYSDHGIHNIKLAVAACNQDEIDEQLTILCHPLSFASNTCHKGKLSLTGTLLKIIEGVRVSAVKPSEDGKGIVVRMYDVSGKDRNITLEICKNIKEAFVTDTNENVLSSLSFEDNKINLCLEANTVKTVKLVLA